MAHGEASTSFVVRVRVGRPGSGVWRGEVEYVRTGQRVVFVEEAALLEFLRARLTTKHWEVSEVKQKRMRWRKSALGALAIAAVLALAGSGTGVAQTAADILHATLMEPNQKTVEVTTAELQKILREGSALVFDARPFREYAISHVPGALNVSPKPGVSMSVYLSDVREIERRVGGNKAQPIVLYCNGPFCGKSKRLAEELIAVGFTNVRRYQVGIPVWRALVGLTEIELEAALYVHQNDRTAVFVDAREAAEFKAGSLPRAINIPRNLVLVGKDVGEILKAKNDGRLPMEDHNTRIIVFGKDTAQARFVAEQIGKEAFHNTSYFVGTYETLRSVIK